MLLIIFILSLILNTTVLALEISIYGNTKNTTIVVECDGKTFKKYIPTDQLEEKQENILNWIKVNCKEADK